MINKEKGEQERYGIMDGLVPGRLRSENEPARLIFVHAHPDDESIATGATMARHVEYGDEVTLITCTRGELGEVIPPELQELEVGAPTRRNPRQAVDKTGDALASERTKELADAMRVLGVKDHRFLGAENARDPRIGHRRYKDSGMAQPGSGDVAGPHAEDPTYGVPLRSGEEVFASHHHRRYNPSEHHRLSIEEALQLAYVIRAIRPHAIISYAHDGGYGHPDHVRASEITCDAVNYAAMGFPEHHHCASHVPAWSVPLQYFIKDCYPGNGGRESEGPEGKLVVMNATACQYRKKQEAMAAHRTQIILDGNGKYALSNEVWDTVERSEEYILVENPCDNLKRYGTYEWPQGNRAEVPETSGVTEFMPEKTMAYRRRP